MSFLSISSCSVRPWSVSAKRPLSLSHSLLLISLQIPRPWNSSACPWTAIPMILSQSSTEMIWVFYDILWAMKWIQLHVSQRPHDQHSVMSVDPWALIQLIMLCWPLTTKLLWFLFPNCIFTTVINCNVISDMHPPWKASSKGLQPTALKQWWCVLGPQICGHRGPLCSLQGENDRHGYRDL